MILFFLLALTFFVHAREESVAIPAISKADADAIVQGATVGNCSIVYGEKVIEAYPILLNPWVCKVQLYMDSRLIESLRLVQQPTFIERVSKLVHDILQLHEDVQCPELGKIWYISHCEVRDSLLIHRISFVVENVVPTLCCFVFEGLLIGIVWRLYCFLNTQEVREANLEQGPQQDADSNPVSSPEPQRSVTSERDDMLLALRLDAVAQWEADMNLLDSLDPLDSRYTSLPDIEAAEQRKTTRAMMRERRRRSNMISCLSSCGQEDGEITACVHDQVPLSPREEDDRKFRKRITAKAKHARRRSRRNGSSAGDPAVLTSRRSGAEEASH